ncbi:MAG: class I SAM-dependent methyltransferase [Nocardioidaceae bacterium]
MGANPRSESDTAYRHWDALWGRGEGRADWSQPDPWVVDVVASLTARNVRTVLDLGCGIGRHTVLLASRGFACYALDLSGSGIAATQETVQRAGLTVNFTVGGMHDLPYDTASFDYVLAFNVVYHGDESAVGKTLAEVRRVLRPGGVYQSTMLSKRNSEYGVGIEISPNTFQQPDAHDDKVHPHLYCDAHDLLRMHPDMELLSATDRDQGRAGSAHWHCLFETN